jgi:aldehyde dehydrogenase (NAD+)
MAVPSQIPNWIEGKEIPATSGEWLGKLNPATGQPLCLAARSGKNDMDAAIRSAERAHAAWDGMPAVQRGMILHNVVRVMQDRQQELATVVAAETGMAPKAALGETGGAIALGLFYASEAQRLYGKTTTSGIPNKMAMTVRQSLGVAGLITAANTPIANVAWKVFPALVCGNTAVLKAAEDAPATALLFGQIAHSAGLPPGVLNIVQGLGGEVGACLVNDPRIPVISFTGSSAVGRSIAEAAGRRMARVSLELGGKNPFVVCDDADLENAARWALLSAFSNAGQRCASGSRIIVFDAIYDKFRDMLVERTKKLSIGPTDDDDLGPVINERQLKNMLVAINEAGERGARVLVGGKRLCGDVLGGGFYMAPTLIENVDPDDDISTTELFGPVACLYRVKDFGEALALANRSPYGLTSCIHTRSINRAMQFTRKVAAGVAVVNAATYGSEPHMPFGGVKQSGNGTREPGTEALDIYSNLKDVYMVLDPDDLNRRQP